MVLFWFITAVIFLIIEIITLTFGFIFITIGAVINTFLIGTNIILSTDFLYQILIMLFFGLASFLFFYKNYRKLKNNTIDSFKEDMTAIVINSNLVKGFEGKVKWSGTICNAMLNQNSALDVAEVGSKVIISEFKGNIAIIDVNNN